MLSSLCALWATSAHSSLTHGALQSIHVQVLRELHCGPRSWVVLASTRPTGAGAVVIVRSRSHLLLSRRVCVIISISMPHAWSSCLQ